MKSILHCYKNVERQGWSGNNKGVLAKKGRRVCWKEEGGERREGRVCWKEEGKEGREGMLERRGWGKKGGRVCWKEEDGERREGGNDGKKRVGREGYIGKVRVLGTPSNV